MPLLSVVDDGVKLEGDISGDDKSTKNKDFQAQFLEFSQRRQQLIDTDQAASISQHDGVDKGKGVDCKTSVSHIAALLQVSSGRSLIFFP